MMITPFVSHLPTISTTIPEYFNRCLQISCGVYIIHFLRFAGHFHKGPQCFFLQQHYADVMHDACWFSESAAVHGAIRANKLCLHQGFYLHPSTLRGTVS